jgi:hypothetical protein
MELGGIYWKSRWNLEKKNRHAELFLDEFRQNLGEKWVKFR